MKVVLTFDDGYRSHYDFVREALLERSMTGTFFICGELIAEDPSNRWKGRIGKRRLIKEFMTWPEVVHLHQDGFELGNHLWRHRHVTENRERTIFAWSNALDEKFKELNIPRPETFAYPGFLYDNQGINAIKKLGLKAARAGKGAPHDRYTIRCDAVFGAGFHPSRWLPEQLESHTEPHFICCFHDINEAGSDVDIPKEAFLYVLDEIKNRGIETVSFKQMAAERFS